MFETDIHCSQCCYRLLSITSGHGPGAHAAMLHSLLQLRRNWVKIPSRRDPNVGQVRQFYLITQGRAQLLQAQLRVVYFVYMYRQYVAASCPGFINSSRCFLLPCLHAIWQTHLAISVVESEARLEPCYARRKRSRGFLVLHVRAPETSTSCVLAVRLERMPHSARAATSEAGLSYCQRKRDWFIFVTLSHKLSFAHLHVADWCSFFMNSNQQRYLCCRAYLPFRGLTSLFWLVERKGAAPALFSTCHKHHRRYVVLPLRPPQKLDRELSLFCGGGECTRKY